MKKLIIGFLTAMVVVVGVLAFPKVAEAIPLSQAFYWGVRITESNSTGWTDYAWAGQYGYPSKSWVRVEIKKKNGLVLRDTKKVWNTGGNHTSASVNCGKGDAGRKYAFSLIIACTYGKK